MGKNLKISIFLLCLLWIVNWHNTFLHSHDPNVKDSTSHSHAHSHSHQHSHDHHQHTHKLSFWAWIQQLVHDFEHPDLGDKHLELFIKSAQKIKLNQSQVAVLIPFLLSTSLDQTMDKENQQSLIFLKKILSFSDPPYLRSIIPRGPPIFS